MESQFPIGQSRNPQSLVVDVSSELEAETLCRRTASVNVILRLAMLAGLRMEMDATLNLLADLVHEIVPFDRALVYFWEEHEEQVSLRLERGMRDIAPDMYCHGNMLNVWARRFGRPLVFSAGMNDEADAFLDSVYSSAALVLPVVANNRVMGSLQLFSLDLDHFTSEDAQLLWILLLVAESQLTREHAN